MMEKETPESITNYLLDRLDSREVTEMKGRWLIESYAKKQVLAVLDEIDYKMTLDSNGTKYNLEDFLDKIRNRYTS